MVFKFAYFVELTKGYQPGAISLQSFSSVDCLNPIYTEGLQTHNDDVIVKSFHSFGIQNFKTDYRLSTCQVSNPSVI